MGDRYRVRRRSAARVVVNAQTVRVDSEDRLPGNEIAVERPRAAERRRSVDLSAGRLVDRSRGLVADGDVFSVELYLAGIPNTLLERYRDELGLAAGEFGIPERPAAPNAVEKDVPLAIVAGENRVDERRVGVRLRRPLALLIDRKITGTGAAAPRRDGQIVGL